MKNLLLSSSMVWLAACGAGAGGALPDAAPVDVPTAPTDATALPDVPFDHPDPPPTYVPQPGTCGFDSPAFCDTFETGPSQGGRAGELDPAHWSVVRGSPYNSASFDDAFGIGPALIGTCRADLSNARVLPDSDVLICDPIATIPTRHVLATTAAQNYGLSTYRIRQPFDFTGRMGTIKLDIDLSNNGLGGWPALILAEDPSAAPSFDWQERGSGPRNGIEIEFGTGWCNTPHTLEPIIYTFADYLQTSFIPSFDCAIAHAMTAPDSLNHVEIYLTQTHVEVWTSDASPDGVTFPNLHLLWAGDVALPFSRGYVSLALRNHATMKYWLGSAALARWDNVGFDGPVVTGWRDYSAPDSLTPTQGLSGCTMNGPACQWEGDVIPAYPSDDGRVLCAQTACTYDGQGRNVGYVIPNLDESVAPVALHFSGVTRGDATRARLILAAEYPWFSWNNVFPPPTQLDLRFRVNGGAWHDRFITTVEANAFIDFSPDLGGAGAGAGLLNQAIDVDPAELQDGDNLVELQADGTWTGSYRVAVTGVDLVLDDEVTP
ncbi:MAG TPA: hypothetical protein VGP07_20745 [Polyangia bacterium]|jgi:hypothetical protein